MNFNFDVIIIGAGVSSSAIARELSGYKSSICVLNALIEESNLTIPQVWRWNSDACVHIWVFVVKTK